MKRIIALLLVVVLLCGMLTVTAFADNVVSPEYDEPEDPTPSSPQTGYGFDIVGVVIAAVLFAAAAVVLGKKAFQR